MFTGLIREVGTVRSISSAAGGKVFEIDCLRTAENLQVGGSVAINGACITVTELVRGGFKFNAAPETLKKTTLGAWRTGTKVNLEPPLKVGDLLDGHWVLGHVDGTVRVSSRKTVGDSVLLTVEIPGELVSEIVGRGSVALDGVSLTVAELSGRRATVSLVPFTLANTNLKERRVGDPLNIETDILGKHIIHLLGHKGKHSNITIDLLKDQGYV